MSTPLLEARDLTVRFGKVTALDGLELSAPAGQVLAILGPNGAGKTTFVRTVATLVRPDSGQLLVRGHDVIREARAVRRDIGLAGQFAAVEPAMTGRENLVMTARLFGHGRRAAARAADDVIGQLSLEEVADRRAATYSGGQRRRLDLGASLVGGPRLLLLDEPTTGLDPVSLARGLGRRPDPGLDRDRDPANHPLPGRGRRTGWPGRRHRSRARGRRRAGRRAEDQRRAGRDRGGGRRRRARSGRQRAAGPDHWPAAAGGSRRAPDQCAGPGGPAELAALISQLESAAITVDEIGIRRPTLDEVFVTLTDHTAAQPAASDLTGSLR